MNIFTKDKLAMVGAEFFGAAFLVLMFIILARTTAVSYFVATSVAVTTAVIYMVFARVSGAHANPAVTFGMWTARKVSTIRGLVYIVSQLLGALAALAVYQYLVDKALPKVTAMWDWPVFVAEMIGAIIITMAYAAVMARRDEEIGKAVTVGAAVFVGVMIAALAVRAGTLDPQTGQAAYKGFANPAAALAMSRFTFDWSYIVGPLVGGLIGVNVYNELFGKGKSWVAMAAPAKTKTTSKKKK